MAFQIARLIAVVALLCAAAAIATPRGRLPLALRGLAKMVNAVPSPSRVAGAGQPDAPSHATRRGRRGYDVSPGKRTLALFLVLLAILLALI